MRSNIAVKFTLWTFVCSTFLFAHPGTTAPAVIDPAPSQVRGVTVSREDMIRVADAALNAGIAVQRDAAEAGRVLELARLRDEMLSAKDPICKILGVVIQELMNRAVLSSLGRANADGTFASQLAEWRRYAPDMRLGTAQVRRLILSLDRGMATALRDPLGERVDWTDAEMLGEIEELAELNAELRKTWKDCKGFEAASAIMFLPPEIAKQPDAAANVAFSIAVFLAQDSTRLSVLLLALSNSGKAWDSDLKQDISHHLSLGPGQIANRFQVTPGSVANLVFSANSEEAEFRGKAASLMRPFLPYELLRDHWPEHLRDPEGWDLLGGIGYLLPPAN